MKSLLGFLRQVWCADNRLIDFSIKCIFLLVLIHLIAFFVLVILVIVYVIIFGSINAEFLLGAVGVQVFTLPIVGSKIL